MNLQKILPLILSLTLTQFTAVAENVSVDELFKQLEAAVAEATKEAPRKLSDTPIQQTLQGIRRAVAYNYNSRQIEQQISLLNSMLPDEKIQALTKSLLETLQQQQEVAKTVFVREVDEQVDAAVKKCLSAKEPAELDALLMKLASVNSADSSDYRAVEPSRRAAAKANSAVDLLCRWQDYLMQQKSGNYSTAYAIMENLAKNSSNYPFIQRSELLSRMEEMQKLKNFPAGESNLPDLKGKTLADLPALIIEAEQLQRKRGADGQNLINADTQQLNAYLSNLKILQAASEACEQDFFGRAYNECLRNRNGHSLEAETGARNRTGALRNELLLKILPSYLETPKPLPVEKNENAAQYLQRVAATARAQGDWVTAWKALTVYREVAFDTVSTSGTPAWLSADIQGLSLLGTAQNQEQAGLFVDAINSYKRVAGLSGQNLPIEFVTKKLAELKKDHPEDYATAEKAAAEPAVRSLPPGGYPYSR